MTKRDFNPYKAELTAADEQYLAQNNELRLARERALESGRMDEIREAYDVEVLGYEYEDDDEEVETVDVEEFAAQADKASIMAQLDALEPPVKYDSKASRDKLAAQLVSEVKSRKQG